VRLIDRLSRRFDAAGGWEGNASGAAVFTTTYGSPDREAILPNLTAFANEAYSGNSIVFGAILARLSLFSQARFAYQDLGDEHLWGADVTDGRRATGLRKLERPWPNGTTGELLARMIQDADLAGNAYIWDNGDHLVRLRPDQVTIVSREMTDPMGRTYREVVGYYWDPKAGFGQPSKQAQYYDVSEVAHWSPIPDPLANFRGMSWMTPVVREIRADSALTDYKLRYLDNAATPNILIKYKQKLLPETIDSLRERMHARYGGMDNAFKTLILDQGADATVVGNSLEQMNFTTVQAAGENRILIASGTPGIVVGSKEGLMAATYSNYKQAMRRFSDITMWQLWPSVCACLSSIIDVPSGSRLWMRTSDIPALQEDEKERADATLVKANAVAALTRYGYDPKTVILAVQSGDFSLLAHSGLAIDIVTEVPKAAPQPLVLAPPTAAEQKTGTAVQPTTKQIPAGVNGSKPAGTGGNDGGL
jgi:phage portal protein BeeE